MIRTVSGVEGNSYDKLALAQVKQPLVTSFINVGSGSGHGKELIMHCLMYGLSLYSELNELRS
jgi:hypothetical protein